MRKGFTFIELMVVIVILGIFAIMIASNMSGCRPDVSEVNAEAMETVKATYPSADIEAFNCVYERDDGDWECRPILTINGRMMAVEVDCENTLFSGIYCEIDD